MSVRIEMRFVKALNKKSLGSFAKLTLQYLDVRTQMRMIMGIATIKGAYEAVSFAKNALEAFVAAKADVKV